MHFCLYCHDQIASYSSKQLERLLQNPQTYPVPAELLIKIVNNARHNGLYEIIKLACAQPLLPTECITNISDAQLFYPQNFRLNISQAIAQHNNTNNVVLSLMAKYDDPNIKLLILNRADIQDKMDLVFLLSESTDSLVRDKANEILLLNIEKLNPTQLERIANRSQNITLLKKLIVQDGLINYSVINNVNIAPSMFEILLKECTPAQKVQIASAIEKYVPHEILSILAKDENPTVRIAIAKNYRTSKKTIVSLAADSDYIVRLMARNNENFNINEIMKISSDFVKNIKENKIINLSKEYIKQAVLAGKAQVELVKDEIAASQDRLNKAELLLKEAKRNDINIIEAQNKYDELSAAHTKLMTDWNTANLEGLELANKLPDLKTLFHQI